jgi:hypothetical protein
MELDHSEQVIGESAAPTPPKVFISYNRKDTQWLKRLQVHLKPIERKGLIDLWDDTRITMGTRWNDAIQQALETARVAVTIVSADFLASDFILEYELPVLLARAASQGTLIIPIIVAPCLFTHSDLSVFQAANAPDRPLSALKSPESEAVLVNVAKAIARHLADPEPSAQAHKARPGFSTPPEEVENPQITEQAASTFTFNNHGTNSRIVQGDHPVYNETRYE